VSGDGSSSPDILFIGRDPGREEDDMGRPFVGRSGKDLRNTVAALGLSPDQVRYTNTVRCHTPGDIGPDAEQLAACFPYLLQEIDSVRPKVIVALGKEASQTILATKKSITALRGRPLSVRVDYIEYPLVVTHHPARLYRQPSLRDEFFLDLQLAVDILHGDVVDPNSFPIATVMDEESLRGLTEYIETSGSGFTYDLETTTAYPWFQGSRILCLGLTLDGESAFVIPISYGLPGDGENWGEAGVRAWEALVLPYIRRILTCPNSKQGQNVSFDKLYPEVLYSIVTVNANDDTMLQHYCTDERVGTHGLEQLAAMIGLSGYDDPIHPYYPDRMHLAPWSVLSRYNGLDCIVTHRVATPLMKKIRADRNLLRVYKNILTPSMIRLPWITKSGVAVDLGAVATAREELKLALETLLASLRETADELGFSKAYLGELEKARTGRTQAQKEAQKPDYEQWVYAGKDPHKFKWKRAATVKPEDIQFDPGSSKKLSFLLFSLLGAPIQRRSKKTKNPSTDEETLLLLQEKFPVVRKILEFRGMAKELNTYCKMLETYTVDGIIHPGMRQHTTVTGRLSSSDPPIQNFPRKSPLRSCFVSRWRDQGILMECDQSQMELRVLACLSKDPGLLRAYSGDPETGEGPKDIHTLTASRIFHLPEKDQEVSDVLEALGPFNLQWEYVRRKFFHWVESGEYHARAKSIPDIPSSFLEKYVLLVGDNGDLLMKKRGVGPEERQAAKSVNFGIVYGLEAKGLSEQLHIPQWEAEKFIESYFNAYPGVRAYIDRTKDFIRRNKYVVSKFGRYRRLPEVDSSDKFVQEEAYRQGVNFTIQSPASDITTLAYNDLYDWVHQRGLQSVVWALIHDAINWDSPLKEWPLVAKMTQHFLTCQRANWIIVPLLAEVSIGSTWKECKDEANNVTSLLQEITFEEAESLLFS
jgi:uracil-DNA glycosylase family 4